MLPFWILFVQSLRVTKLADRNWSFLIIACSSILAYTYMPGHANENLQEICSHSLNLVLFSAQKLQKSFSGGLTLELL